MLHRTNCSDVRLQVSTVTSDVNATLIEYANGVLRATENCALALHACVLLRNGVTSDEAAVALEKYRIQLVLWRTESLIGIARSLIGPDASSQERLGSDQGFMPLPARSAAEMRRISAD
jgi:hypothetical protein